MAEIRKFKCRYCFKDVVFKYELGDDPPGYLFRFCSGLCFERHLHARALGRLISLKRFLWKDIVPLLIRLTQDEMEISVELEFVINTALEELQTELNRDPKEVA
jgi:hypothetical protein